jgi:hypothetical protein
MSFNSKKQKQKHDSDYLQYLMLQLNNLDKIEKRQKDIDLGNPVQGPIEDNRSLAEKLRDKTLQRNNAYKNASILFDKDTTRINSFMHELDEDGYIFFNQKFPDVNKNLKGNNSIVTPAQVLDFLDRLDLRQRTNGDVPIPLEGFGFNNGIDRLITALDRLYNDTESLASMSSYDGSDVSDILNNISSLLDNVEDSGITADDLELLISSIEDPAIDADDALDMIGSLVGQVPAPPKPSFLDSIKDGSSKLKPSAPPASQPAPIDDSLFGQLQSALAQNTSKLNKQDDDDDEDEDDDDDWLDGYGLRSKRSSKKKKAKKVSGGSLEKELKTLLRLRKK